MLLGDSTLALMQASQGKQGMSGFRRKMIAQHRYHPLARCEILIQACISISSFPHFPHLKKSLKSNLRPVSLAHLPAVKGILYGDVTSMLLEVTYPGPNMKNT